MQVGVMAHAYFFKEGRGSMMNWEMLSVFIVVFVGVTILAFWAARWRQGDLNRLQEWGLAGRRFGTIVTWCLLGGDIYTAYTLIALPGFVFAVGALGFYAIPYATLAYVVFFLLMPKFWTVARHCGYVTPADFVRERFDSPALALLVAITGILAVMPYIALQMYGMEVVIAQMGVPVEISLLIAFAFLAAYTYIGGIRAPALMAIVKDICIWLVVLVAVIVIPIKLGGFGAIFQQVHMHALTDPQHRFQDVLAPTKYSAYVSLIIGSVFSIFLYPHILTGALSANSAKVLRRSSVLLLAYTLLLALVALLGFVAVADGIKPSPVYGINGALPELFAKEFPGWFAGFSFAALAIGALAPAAIMSIAAANLFSRNIYREYINRACTEHQEAKVAKISSLVVKLGALVFILLGPTNLAINLQHMGNVWIIQTLPTVFLGLYTNWFHRRALILGLLGGLLVGSWMLLAQNLLSPSWSSIVSISFLNIQIPLYAAVPSLVVNLVLSVGLTPIFRLLGVSNGRDYTALTEFKVRSV
jgi:SSS family solute:Na+ symporter